MQVSITRAVEPCKGVSQSVDPKVGSGRKRTRESTHKSSTTTSPENQSFFTSATSSSPALVDQTDSDHKYTTKREKKAN
ncbi:hypothetical protein CHS0354_012896 [Potamilus streckersoni]|uniref:Uncharacterized protein n=1 Tax=Potamilus streckersoni TaxID=2493646 RepID=A0AAE0SAN3_9BIVA|nr:hypothetical protein CHS0354_012896 [Potamilus streckersoni]